MNFLEKLSEAVRMADTIRELSSVSSEFFAIIICVDLEKLESSILDGIRLYEEAKNCGDDVLHVNIDNLNDKVALLNSLKRFRDDVATTTEVGRKCKQKYEEMKAKAS